jgi:8-oxo-dGTP diphosphatase
LTVLLVRHAEAGDRSRWSGPDEVRPLTPEGWRQAEGLVAMLSGFVIRRLVSSPHVRCRQTVEPLAASRVLPIDDDQRLAEGGGIAEALDLLAAGDDAAMCSHGDIIKGTVRHLHETGVPLDGGLQWQKGSTWVLQIGNGEIVSGRYLPPPDTGAGEP